MEIVITVYDDDGKYFSEIRVNSIQEAQDFISETDAKFNKKED